MDWIYNGWVWSFQNIIQKQEMNQYTTYGQFLNQSYRKILQACLEDEAIDTLKILQNKDYLLLRINQLFSEIYVAQREKMIQDQAVIISSLQQQTQQGIRSVEKMEKCFNCSLMKEHISEMEHQISEFEKKVSQTQMTQEKSVKKIESMLLKQIQGLKKNLKQLQQENIYKKIDFEQQTSRLTQQNTKLKAYLKQESEKGQKNAERLKSKLINLQQQKEILQNQVFKYLQVRGKEEKEIRQLNTKYANLNMTKERQQSQLGLIRNENNILLEKIRHLENDNEYLKEKNDKTEKQVKLLKKKLDQAVVQAQSYKNDRQKTENGSHFNEQAISCEDISKRKDMQRRNIELQKIIQALKQELCEKEYQFNQKSMQSEKTILKLNDQLRKAHIKVEKQMKSNKQQYKKVMQKKLEESEYGWRQEKQDLIKRNENILAEKENLCQRLQQKIITLNRNLNQNQHYLKQCLKQHENQKTRLQRQIQQERLSYNELKKYYNTEKLSQEVQEKQSLDKYHEITSQKEELQKLLLIKQKQIREYKKEILKCNEQLSTLQIKMDDAKNKYAAINQSIDEQRTKSKGIAQKLREKTRQCAQIAQNYSQLLQEKEELGKKVALYKVNQKRLQQKIRRFESEMIHKRQLLLSMHEANQQEVIDVFAKAQQSTAEARKQLQTYYINLLKTNEEKVVNATIHQLQKQQQEELERMRMKNTESEQRLKKIKLKYSQQEKQRLNNESKINGLIQQNDQLKLENGKVMQMVHEQKKKNLNIIKAYQDKMLEYYNNFSEFKRQFYLSLKQQLSSVKASLYQIGESAKQQKMKYQQCISQYAQKIAREIDIVTHKQHLQIQKVRHEYEYQRILKIEQQKREIKMQCDMKMKEQSIEFYTIMAQKQHQISAFTQRQARLQKKIAELDEKSDQIERISRQTLKKNQQLKEIINKMNTKVAESQRSCNSAQNQLEFYKKSNLQLKKEISQLQTNFKEKIEECRQKYSSQNERLFAKYEKQFSKFIVSNKKGLEFSMLSNSCSNIHVPTKGVPSQGKLDKIQKQIEQQKRKLNILEKGMQTKVKFEKTSKIAVERDNPKIERYKRY